MKKLLKGASRFRTEVFPEMKGLFDALAAGQRPTALFITCADSRIDPSLITQSAPGTLFVVRNTGNVIPPGAAGSEGAAVEYAIEVLGVRHIVVCGHYGCGAIHALLEPSKTTSLPLVRNWLDHVGEVKEAIIRRIADVQHRDLERVGVEYNVQLQLLHLEMHPSILAARAKEGISLHGWVYDLTEGTLHGWDPASERWQLLGE